jgi:protein TonB
MPRPALVAAAGLHLAVVAAVLGVWNSDMPAEELRAVEVEIVEMVEPSPPHPERQAETVPQASPEMRRQTAPVTPPIDPSLFPLPEPPPAVAFQAPAPEQQASAEAQPQIEAEAPPIDPMLIPLPEPPPVLVLQPPKPPLPKPVPPKPAPPAVAAPPPLPPAPAAPAAPASPAAAPRRAVADPRYIDRLAAAIERERDYPVASRRRGEQGRVTLNIVIAANGHLISAEIVGSSGFDALDKAALGMVRRANLPPLGPQFGAESASFTIPIVFAVR